MTGSDFSEITKATPEKSLTVSLKKNAGRNNQGKITVRHRGGGSRRKYRIIDFKRRKDDVPATVKSIEYDPNRTANIALICYADGEKAYILAPEGLKVGMKVMSGAAAEVRPGNCLPLSEIPVGTMVHNVELHAGKGGQLVRSAGNAAQLMAKEGKYATLRLPSGEMRMVPIICRATVGVIGNGGRGTADYFGLTDKVDIIMGTFSKSLASLGGYMAGDKRVVNYVRHASRPFIFCASIPPANCATAIEALHILRSHPEMPKRLVELAAYMRKGLLERGIAIRDSITPIIPIYTYDEMRTLRKAKELFDAGVYVNPVLPPATPPGESLLRTSYMANHTETILDEALDIIERIVKND